MSLAKYTKPEVGVRPVFGRLYKISLWKYKDHSFGGRRDLFLPFWIVMFISFMLKFAVGENQFTWCWVMGIDPWSLSYGLADSRTPYKLNPNFISNIRKTY